MRLVLTFERSGGVNCVAKVKGYWIEGMEARKMSKNLIQKLCHEKKK